MLMRILGLQLHWLQQTFLLLTLPLSAYLKLALMALQKRLRRR